ncbi:MAG: sigma-70 family RNA polymerase sigma factor [Desulfobacterales bacterium]|nr:sigma-70 family RNA polymerase sigma factor [Desulfobacterales bacterium]
MDRNKILAGYYGLIWRISQFYYDKIKRSSWFNTVINREDLFTEGVIGAIKGIDSFNDQKGSLTAWINCNSKWQIINYIRDVSPISQQQYEQTNHLKTCETALTQKIGKEPTDQELADYMNLSLTKIFELRSGLPGTVDYTEIKGCVKDHEEKPDQYVMILDLMEKLIQSFCECIISDLNENQRFVFVQHSVYGLKFEILSKMIDRSLGATHKRYRNAEITVRQCLTAKGWPEKDLEILFKLFGIEETHG